MTRTAPPTCKLASRSLQRTCRHGLVLTLLLFAGCNLKNVAKYTSPTPVGPMETLALEQVSGTPPITPENVQESDIPYLQVTQEAEAKPFSLQELDEIQSRSAPASVGREGEPVPLGLEEIRLAALQGNLDLRVIEMTPDIERSRISEEVGRFEATFRAAFNSRRNDAPPFNAQLGDSVDLVTQSFDPTIEMPLYTGGSVRLEEGLFRTSPLNPADDSIYDSTYGIGVTHPLLRGAGLAVNTAPIRVADLRTGIAEANTRFNAILVLAEAERAYWQLFVAREVLRVTQEQLELAARQLGAAKRLAEARVLPRVETLRTESGLQLRADAYITAKTSVKLLERNLKRIIQRPDLPFFESSSIVPRTKPQPIGLRLNPQVLVDRALQNRMDLLQLQLQKSATNIQIDVERNSLLPQLQLEFYAKLLGTGRTHRLASDQAFGDRYDDAFIGLSAEIPLQGNLAAQSRLRRAELELVQTQLTEDSLRVAVMQQVLDALDRFEQNWQRILAAGRAVQATQATYRAEVRLFELGQRTGDLVLDAAERLATAQVQEAQALGDYEIAKVDLAVATGTVLGYGNIEWDVGSDDATEVPPFHVNPAEPLIIPNQ